MSKSKQPAEEPNRYPPGLNYEKVQEIANYYDSQKDEDVLSDVETSQHASQNVWIEIPQEILPAVRKLIVKHRKSA